MSPKEVIQSAIANGACNLSGKATDWKSLAWLLFSPQGREFCELKKFPPLEMWREMKPLIEEEKNVLVDEGDISLDNVPSLAVIGNTSVDISYSGADTIHKLIIMHGAKAHVRASNYAVVLIVRIGDGCELTIKKDNTSKILQ